MAVHPLQDIAGVPESALADADAARLPHESAPAPWDVVLDAVVWLHRAAPGASQHAATAGRRALPVTVGALISYRETPVGPYREVLGSPVLLAEWPLPASTIPFIAVDSPASVHGGRANWRLPKTLARFDWPESTDRSFELDAEGDGWSVHASVQARRRRFPVAGVVRTRQLDTAFTTRARGRARLASVALETRGSTLPRWLRSGRHPALVIEGARGVVGPAA
jgi:hypothetical protein